MNDEDVRDLLRLKMSGASLTSKRCIRKGTSGLSAWCNAHGVTKSHASEFLNRKRGPGLDLLNALGLVKGYGYKSDGTSS
jgi:hypothetical protein